MRSVTRTGFIACICLTLFASQLRADSVEEINAKSLNALVYLGKQVEGVEAFMRDAAAVLVFPDIVKVGFGLGGQYGEGVLLVDGKPDGYYATAGASFGLQMGAQFKSEVIVFVTEEALSAFRERRGLEVGVDASVALITSGAGKALYAPQLDQPIVGFIFSNEGLMANLTLEGAKITKLAR